MALVVGSQIVGAQPTDTLPVVVVGEKELDAIAASSGDDLFRSIPQLGDVSFNTSRTIGSLNDARGDTASINLRALGTGNTLVLLNGGRMVNHPGTQAENLVPVVTVNTTSIPTTGITAAAAAGTRVRIGARNLFDEVPPLADTNFGYLGDLHNPQGRFVSVNVHKTF